MPTPHMWNAMAQSGTHLGFMPGPDAHSGNAVPVLSRSEMQIPTNWTQDAEYLDAARSVCNLTLPRFVQQTTWAKSEGIAGRPVLDLHPAHFLYQNWNSYWLRHISHGPECYMMAAQNKGELVLAQELLVQLRTQNVDLESAAMNVATQQHQSLAKNLAMKTLANYLGAGDLKVGTYRH